MTATKRLILLLTLLVGATDIALAQSTTSEINAIKRDSTYLYGDATLDSQEAAMQLAFELLEGEVRKWAADSKRTLTIDKEALKEMADTMMTHRRNMVRVFAYVNKATLLGGPKPMRRLKPQTLKPQTTPEPKSQPPVVTQQEAKVLSKITAVTSLGELGKVLPPLKEEGLITDFGKYATITEPAKCYLVIYDADGNVKAFLGKGTDKRKNLKTGAMENEHDYKRCGAIWFKVKE